MAVPEHVRDLLRSPARIALVGASSAPEKYGNIIFKDLAGRGHAVLPVNPSASMIEGQPAYASVADVPRPIDIVNVVVPPRASLALARSLDPGICGVIWFQPGSFDDQVVQEATARFETVIAGDCIMVVARTL
ncbi:MAG: CoA-binding protein [Myxococcales bacterium]